MLLRAAAVIAVMALTPALAFAETGHSKLEMFEAIQKNVYGYAYFSVFDDVNAAIGENGAVTLTGWVTEPYKKNEIGKRVARAEGVTAVENTIEVLPQSRVDDLLRLRVAHAIYDHPWFQHYSKVSAPIHIVVERGNVTLAGVVDTERDKTLAPWLARGSSVCSRW